MYRIFRPGRLLACASALALAPFAQGADPDYVLEETQVSVAIASAGPNSVGSKIYDFGAFEPAIATAPEKHRAVVVWSADDTATRAGAGDEEEPIYIVDDEFEIFAQIVDSVSLDGVGDKQRVSVMGDDYEYVEVKRRRFTARNPAVVWNPVTEEFLIVWEGDDDAAPLVDDEFEIFGQRMSVDGELLGDRIRISIMGDDAVADPALRAAYDAHHPAVAANTTTGEYVVVWQGDDNAAPLVDDEVEVFGRVLDATATPVGGQVRLSFSGDDTETVAGERIRYASVQPEIAFNPVSNSFFVAWQADDNQGGVVDDENEIYLAQLNALATPDCGSYLCPAVPASPDPVRISTMGPDGDTAFDGLNPSLAVHGTLGTVLVTWHGDTLEGALVDDEFEVHGRLFDANAVPLATQFRISTMGLESATDPAVRAQSSATTVRAAWSSPFEGHFFVTWRGDTPEGILVDDEFEIFGAFIEPDGSILADEIRISVQGDDGESAAENRTLLMAESPSVAYADGNFIAVWDGDTNVGNGIDNQFQVFGQRVATTSTTLELAIERATANRIVPKPIEIVLSLTNSGDVTARNSSISAALSHDFPVSWKNCQSVAADNSCQVGDIAADETVEVTLVLTTDHVEYGDDQGTTVTLATHADTALRTPTESQLFFFIGVTLEVKGGSGAVGIFWLLVLPVALVVGTRRRRAKP